MRISDWMSDVCSSERHAFHRLTGGRVDESHPRLSYPRWDRKKYSGSLAGEWERLEAACLLDRAAALQSASWGLFQIMGFNYSYAGFADVEAFVAAQHAGAEQQAGAFARFISRPPLLSALRRRSWQKFAARSEEHTSELQSLMRISYAVSCLKKKNKKTS